MIDRNSIHFGVVPQPRGRESSEREDTEDEDDELEECDYCIRKSQ